MILGCTVCSQRLYKLLKSNKSVEVRKACNTIAGYTLVTHVLLGVVKPLILIRVITASLLSGSDWYWQATADSNEPSLICGESIVVSIFSELL